MSTDNISIPPVQELPILGKTYDALANNFVQRSLDLFSGNQGDKIPLYEDSQRIKIACKMRQEFESTKAYKGRGQQQQEAQRAEDGAEASGLSGPGAARPAQPPKSTATSAKSDTSRLIDMENQERSGPGKQGQLVVSGGRGVSLGTDGSSFSKGSTSADLIRKLPSLWPKPDWHPPWRCYRVISGHLGWVRSIAFDPTNAWFVTGSGDRTIKFWDTASGSLKLTLTGHIEQVTGLAVSDRHPYMFSCALDKRVLCWDLEQNRNIRHYHGHLSGVYCLGLHPELDVLVSGGRDSVARVWDIRTKTQVYCLSGHSSTVASVVVQSELPQVITGSHDNQIKLWDFRTGKAITTLTYHKKSVRSLVNHPREASFLAASADNLKKYKLPEGVFLHNFLPSAPMAGKRLITNCLALNEDNVVASGSDNGYISFWDWKSGNCFQHELTKVQPGSLDSEAGLFAMSFDQSGSRLVTCEADKTIKMWKEDDDATPESHPIVFQPPKDIRRF